MAPLADPILLTAYQNALANRRFEGYVNWTELAARWVRSELEGLTTSAVVELMHDHVMSGGTIDQVPETRPEWRHHEYHYDLRMDIGGRRVCLEPRLEFDDPTNPDDPVILVANIHDA